MSGIETSATPDYGDPSEWDDEFPAGLAAELAEALRGYGWDVTGHHDAGVEIRLPGGHETGVWLAAGGRLWTGLIEDDGTCRNPTQVIADPADPGNVAFNADPLLKLVAARAARMPAVVDEED